jgi:GNAT superfamily N-acetyltransferase
MAFGPETIVTRLEQNRRREPSIRLAPYTVAQLAELLPYPVEAVEFIGSYISPLLRCREPDPYIEEITDAGDRCAWGVWRQGRLAGLAAIIENQATPDVFGFHIALRPEHQGRGIGGMAVAGIVRAVGTPGALTAANPDIFEAPQGLVTMVHGQNTYSQRMCRHAGFVETGRRNVWVDSGLALSEGPLPAAGLTAEQAAASIAARAANETRYTIDVQWPPEPHPMPSGM